MSISRGNFVKWLCPYGYYVYGEVTLTRSDGKSKVLFDGNYDWNYDYYRNEELELITRKEYEDAKSSDSSSSK